MFAFFIPYTEMANFSIIRSGLVSGRASKIEQEWIPELPKQCPVAECPESEFCNDEGPQEANQRLCRRTAELHDGTVLSYSLNRMVFFPTTGTGSSIWLLYFWFYLFMFSFLCYKIVVSFPCMNIDITMLIPLVFSELTLSLPAFHCRQWKCWRIYASPVTKG